MIVRVMRRPQRKAVEAADPPSEYTRCSGCVTRKLCDDAQSCMYGKKAKPKGKRNGRGNGRLSA